MSLNVAGSHSRGPILGDKDALGGLFEDVSLAGVDLARSPYKVWVEQFPHIFADGQLELSGAAVNDINTPTAPTETVTMANGALLLNPGTAASSGVQAQFTLAASAAATNPRLNVMGPIVFGGAAFDGKEFIFFNRYGIVQSDTTVWEGTLLLGAFVTDTSLVNFTTGVPAVSTSGGAGLHIGITGVVSVVHDIAGITVADVLTARRLDSVAALGAAGVIQWYDFGFRYKQISAGASTGNCDYYYGRVGNIQKVLSLTGTAGFLSGTLAISYSITNGATGTTNLADLYVESIVTAVSRASG